MSENESVSVGRTGRGIVIAVTDKDTVLSAEIDIKQAKLLLKLLILAIDDLEETK